MTAQEKTRGARLRRRAYRLGYLLRKSRTRNPHYDDHGLYYIVDFNNHLQWGEKCDLSLDHVEEILANEQKKQTA